MVPSPRHTVSPGAARAARAEMGQLPPRAPSPRAALNGFGSPRGAACRARRVPATAAMAATRLASGGEDEPPVVITGPHGPGVPGHRKRTRHGCWAASAGPPPYGPPSPGPPCTAGPPRRPEPPPTTWCVRPPPAASAARCRSACQHAQTGCGSVACSVPPEMPVPAGVRTADRMP